MTVLGRVDACRTGMMMPAGIFAGYGWDGSVNGVDFRYGARKYRDSPEVWW